VGSSPALAGHGENKMTEEKRPDLDTSAISERGYFINREDFNKLIAANPLYTQEEIQSYLDSNGVAVKD
jgi:hypothetical protein